MAQVQLKGKLTHTAGDLPEVGSRAPEFTLVDGHLKDISLKDFGKKKKILSIVPSLDTGTCSTMTKKLHERLEFRPDVVFIAISADLPFAQKRFCDGEHLTHASPLSMMRSKKFGEDYGVLVVDGPLAGLCARAVILLDEENKVVYTELVPEITTEPNYDALFKYLA
jgi:thiol peroxidase